ncbi:MAG TPA: hypothetical protein VGG28_02655 [Kofleriaceae bacterium]
MIVPDVEHADLVTGVKVLRRDARLHGIPCWLLDPNIDLVEVAAKVRELEHRTRHDVGVLVTGPRLTRWQGGQMLGFRFVAELSFTPSPAIDGNVPETRAREDAAPIEERIKE